MKSPTITFCTYTYNDAEFARDLVHLSRSFTIRPDEIVVVDDGSKVPFAMADAPGNLRIIRFDSNRGITRAKGAGLSAATGDIMFSMDCDTRVSPDWLAQNLPFLDDPAIGLVGGALVYKSGNDLVSRYLAVFGDNHNRHHVGAVDFIPGNAFLLRRQTWEEIGGFSAYAQTNCQDHYLCNQLKSKGYTLFSNARAKACQLRRISRTTMCKRVWKWCHKPIKEQAAQADDVVTYLFGTLVAPMLDRCHDAAEMEEPLFHYLELLYLAHSVMDTLDHLERVGKAAVDLRIGFLSGLAALFNGSRAIWAVFKADMASLGHVVFNTSSGNDTSWDEFFLFSGMFRQGGLLSWLDRTGVKMLMEDDSGVDYHFSSYAYADFSVDIQE